MLNHGFNILHPAVEPPTIPTKHWRLWDIGVTWKDINPAPGVWKYEQLDAMVSLAESHNADICLVLGMTPQWAATDPHAPHAAPWIGPGTNSPPKDLKTWEEYVIHTVNRYKGRIKFYQIWNEPQLADFWYPYSDIDILGRMTRIAYSTIRRIDPAAKVVSAAVLPRPSSGGVRRGRKYLQALKKHNWPIDIHAAHIYPEQNKPPKRFKKLVQRWKTTLKLIRAPKKPLWITEMNYNLHHGEIPHSSIPQYIRMTDKHADDLGVSRVYWYTFGHHSNPNLFGIKFTAGSIGSESLRPYL